MMNKKQIYSTVLACVAISATLVASSLIAGIQFTQPALAQVTAPTPPPPPAPAKKTAAAAGEPPLGKQVNWQGTVSSQPTVPSLTGRSRGDQVAVILSPRKDGGLYTGVVTFTASKPVAIQVWNQLSGVSSTTLIPREFGAIGLSSGPGKSYALALVGPPGTSGSVPFTGNGIALHGTAPFIATYSLTATTAAPTVKNNITSATAAAALSAAAGGGPSLGGGGSSSRGGSSGGTTLGGETGASAPPTLGTGRPGR